MPVSTGATNVMGRTMRGAKTKEMAPKIGFPLASRIWLNAMLKPPTVLCQGGGTARKDNV